MTIQKNTSQEACFCLFSLTPHSSSSGHPITAKCKVNAGLKCQTFVFPPPRGNRQQVCSCGNSSLSRRLLWDSRRGFQAEKVAFRLVRANHTVTPAQCRAKQQKLTFQTTKKPPLQQQAASGAGYPPRPEAQGTPEDSGYDVA